jgi:HPr kinase/phosphorylase
MTQPALTVAGLLAGRPDDTGLPIELLSGGSGVARVIGSPHIQKTGLALAGFHEFLHPARVLVFGESEARYLESLDVATRMQTLAAAFTHDIPCILITGGWNPPADVVAAADRDGVPLLRTTVTTPLAIVKIGAILADALAVREVIHGVLMDILGLGVLIVGDSGIGKSECALDLIVRGHRLVADDTVEVHRRSESVVMGTCPDLTRHHMEVRGIGVINIRDLFGIAATRASTHVELVVQLERWDVEREYERLGIDENRYDLLGVSVPLICMPVAPGRNLAILVEVAARNQILRSRGINAARTLVSRLEQQLRGEPAPPDDREDEGGRG